MLINLVLSNPGKENRPFLSVFTTFKPSVTITPASGLSPLLNSPDWSVST